MAPGKNACGGHELHDGFVEAVNKLGGPDRATPKGILKAMCIPGLNIYHKYRLSKFIPESISKAGKLERRTISEILPHFGTKYSAAQPNEVLKMQMEVQRRMSTDHQLLEVHTSSSLKLKIEAQGRFFDKILEDHQNRTTNVITTKPGRKLPSSLRSLPSLCEESESNAKEFESDDSEADKKSEIQSEEGIIFSVLRIKLRILCLNLRLSICVLIDP
ncbi:hypothetical protein I3843_10G148800 [Carya illinoinensis]|nr:hypothetical protein I3843_10G148800 [Carya illinoinensis]